MSPDERMTRRRGSLRYQLRYAVEHADRIPSHLRRLVRDTVLRIKSGGDHIRYYRGVMHADTKRSAHRAVGSKSHERWLRMGQMQFDYLLAHGLRPEHRLLEIGCGNLRAGWRFIQFLDPGHYYGIDISPDILLAAQDTVIEYELQSKIPRLTLVRDLTFAFLPADHFDVVHAHSVFSHTPLHLIDECFRHIGRILRPAGFFDFTFDRTEGAEHHVLREDFYYRTETLVQLAADHGLAATFMDDWERLPHKQSKIRVSRP